jgi:hypothetical protein
LAKVNPVTAGNSNDIQLFMSITVLLGNVMEALILQVLLGVAVTLASYGYFAYRNQRTKAKRQRALSRHANLVDLRRYPGDREAS